MIEKVYLLSFPFRSLVSMTLKYDFFHATSSVLGFRDFSLDKSGFVQCKMPDTWGILKPSAFMVLVRITSVRVNLQKS